MRTTINLPDDLLVQLKKRAADSGTTMTALLENALREAVSRAGRRSVRTRVKLPTFRGKGVLPGVDLDDSASLLDIMERGQ